MSIFDRFWGSSKKTEAPTQSKPVDSTAALTGGSGPNAVDRRHRKRKNAHHGAKALIIDDSATVVAALRKILRSAGYATREAIDAEKGLALIAEEKPDLIFLDIVLPGMNGFSALRVIRKDISTQHIPVIMISGNEHATEQFYANRIGADDFMKKPFSRFEVFAHIETLLDENRVPRRKIDPTAAPEPRGHTVPAGFAQSSVRDTAPAALGVSEPLARKAVAPAAPVLWSSLDARKELTAMGLQYFSQAHFFAAIRRGDQLAVELFVASGGVAVEEPFESETAMGIAQKIGAPALVSLLQRHAAMPNSDD